MGLGIFCHPLFYIYSFFFGWIHKNWTLQLLNPYNFTLHYPFYIFFYLFNLYFVTDVFSSSWNTNFSFILDFPFLPLFSTSVYPDQVASLVALRPSQSTVALKFLFIFLSNCCKNSNIMFHNSPASNPKSIHKQNSKLPLKSPKYSTKATSKITKLTNQIKPI